MDSRLQWLPSPEISELEPNQWDQTKSKILGEGSNVFGAGACRRLVSSFEIVVHIDHTLTHSNHCFAAAVETF